MDFTAWPTGRAQADDEAVSGETALAASGRRHGQLAGLDAYNVCAERTDGAFYSDFESQHDLFVTAIAKQRHQQNATAVAQAMPGRAGLTRNRDDSRPSADVLDEIRRCTHTARQAGQRPGMSTGGRRCPVSWRKHSGRQHWSAV
ncbi:hypothetical protein [Streptomyces mirabilis]|uniref:hypothetical protein n=1 Tax=Streptomyces mirabilis TaxID=68239 RepID=UPI0033C6A344